MLHQITTQRAFQISGIGLHSGRKVRVQVSPAPVGSGIRLRRTDLTPAQSFSLNAEAVHQTTLNTGLVNERGARLSTVEHLMAAISGLGLDNLLVEVEGPEMPIMDGSAAPFLFLFNEVGLKTQPAPKSFLRVTKPVCVRQKDKYAVLRPANGFRIRASIDFDHPALRAGSQTLDIDLTPQRFADEISRARTFGFLRDIEALHSQGLALGGGFNNAVVLDDYRVLNPEGLRYQDEFVRHKVLDAIGDLRMCGYNLLAELECHKPGHGLNNLLLRELMAREDAWEITTTEPADVPQWRDQLCWSPA
ncbi:UDP-3-O-acyl-N-acetylglucosamine deacetylase [Marinobacterium nitratireducens]|uniref:UDP-3-O-acyl-N-acetylglucosamine deacetylase n=1 Tax=Marinobacterium nitratireducens TaxID=518897 RepID=A0A917Z848_9GAMM|nr:UDP-3-O-acyl-N-acetylglucosamine deacetylase [Marinobacterium nitratireducens]GGO75510.1 UDP-3-O-acyl-N-acetylglucosamine deacetylase [Marinobacterium nitratireducens]